MHAAQRWDKPLTPMLHPARQWSQGVAAMSATMRACGSRVTAFKGAQLAVRAAPLSARGVSSATMMKKGIHPDYHTEAKVMCNGVEVMVTSGTKPVYNVDIYSGNHPFYQGNKSQMVMDEGELNKCV